MLKTTFTVNGNIEEFDRIDNLYRALKREAEKMLSDWEINVEAVYTERQGEKTKQ